MPPLLIRRRLANQRLVRSGLRTPAAVVAWLGAVQAQDYAGARWGVGQRAVGLTDRAVQEAFDRGAILRTHVLRPTWHLVSPDDIGWMLALSAPRVHAGNASQYRNLELDGPTRARSRRVLARALRDGRHLTRRELGAVLARAGIPTASLRLAYVMLDAELEGVVCSGPRRGKQFTYALLGERAPHARVSGRDEALAALTRRYFVSHGPATVRDFCWWSGLTVRDAKAGLAHAGSTLAHEAVGGLTYWFDRAAAPTTVSPPAAWLLPNYDEYLIAYQDRGLVVDTGRSSAPNPTDRVFPHHVVIDGRLAGAWRRRLDAHAVDVEVLPYRRLMPADRQALSRAVHRYGRFLGMPAGWRDVTKSRASRTST